MQSFIEFLFKSFFISASLFAYYLIFLRNRKMHTFNRFYLLSTVAASIIFPLLHFRLYTIAGMLPAPGIKMLQAISAPDEVAPIQHGASYQFTIENVALVLYALAAIAILAITVYKIAWVIKLRKTGHTTRRGNVTVIHTGNTKAPFSFFNMLFWRNTIDIDSTHGQQVLKHEMAHIAQHHTTDKMFMQMVVALCWINPIYWLLQKELSHVHEFIADEAAVEDGGTTALAAMLLQCHYGNMIPHIVNPFFYSSIKRRIIMLNQNKTNYAKVRKLLALPLLAGAAILCSCKITESSSPLSPAKERITMVLDAGHGGNDAGAVGTGVMEKDLNLRICRKIAMVAHEYNIAIVATRRDDKYVVLSSRSEMANKANADLLLSIHVNKSSADNPVNEGYEVIVSDKCPKIDQSKLLASAIIGGMTKDGVAPVFVNKGIFMLKNSNIPAVTIECGRIDNPTELDLLQSDAKLESFCRNILSGVVAYENNAKK